MKDTLNNLCTYFHTLGGKGLGHHIPCVERLVDRVPQRELCNDSLRHWAQSTH